MICSRLFAPGCRKKFPGPIPGVPGQAARGVASGLQVQLLSGVGIQQVRLQHAVLDHHGLAAGHALGIERASAEAAAHGAVVHDSDVVAGNLLVQLTGEERRATVDGVAVDRLEDVANQRTGNGVLEDDGHFRGLDFARANAPQSALCSDLADLFRRLQLLQRHRHRVPVVALHRGAFDLRDRHRRNRAVGAAVVADESMGVGQDLVADGGVEGAAFGIDDAGIGIERGLLGAAGVVDAVGCRERVDIVVVETEIAVEFAELRRFGNSGERVLAGDLGQ